MINTEQFIEIAIKHLKRQLKQEEYQTALPQTSQNNPSAKNIQTNHTSQPQPELSDIKSNLENEINSNKTGFGQNSQNNFKALLYMCKVLQYEENGKKLSELLSILASEVKEVLDKNYLIKLTLISATAGLISSGLSTAIHGDSLSTTALTSNIEIGAVTSGIVAIAIISFSVQSSVQKKRDNFDRIYSENTKHC